jgi:hypothetical protein
LAGIKHRNPGLVFLFGLITLGIYQIYWLVSTTNELRKNTTSAPNPWLLLAPIIAAPLFIFAILAEYSILPVLIYLAVFVVMIMYHWRYSKAINELTGFNAIGMFALLLLLGGIGQIFAQIELNKKAD